jgi:hypothetical protein
VRGSVNTDLNNSGSNSGGGFEIVIIIAIVVASVAFFFLIFAIFWAWRYEKSNRDAYLVNARKGGSADKIAKTGSDNSDDDADGGSPKNSSPVQEVDVTHRYPGTVDGETITAAGYPASMISDDISSSLSQYYQSSMGGGGNPYLRSNANHMNDAASVSSMESYGYSLDGYAPSLATLAKPVSASPPRATEPDETELPSGPPRSTEPDETELPSDGA